MLSDRASLTNTEVWKNIARRKWVHLLLLGGIGLFAFFHNLDVALFDAAEGLYAIVAREMIRTQQFVHLTYFGHAYHNKPPLFFWLVALSTSLFGENEAALRLPPALFSLGTMALTYFLGKTLFSRTAAFWASLVVATTHVFLWYGPLLLFDSALTFFTTLTLFAWSRAFLQPTKGWWQVLAFLGMALGTMIKAIHAFVLPAIVVLMFLIAERDLRPIRARPFWVGLFLFCALLFPYYWILGSEFHQQFFVEQNLKWSFQPSSITTYLTGKNAIYRYFLMVWPDLFPWSVLIPSSLALLLSQRPLRRHPQELFVLLWVIGILLMLSLGLQKRERYLLPVVPGFGLMIGYYYDTVFSSSDEKHWATLPFKLLLGLLTVAYAVGLFFAPYLLHQKWHVPTSVFPMTYVLLMLILCAVLVYALTYSKVRIALLTTGMLAIGFMFGVVDIVVPAIDEATSAKRMVAEIKPFLKRPQDPILVYGAGVTNDDIRYYMYYEHTGVNYILTGKGLEETVRKNGQILILTGEQYLNTLQHIPDFSVKTLREFHRPKDKLFLLAIRLR
ncbi:MAG: ArnT family glycosyltransferase [Candidatus Methylomirabilales bacterium]